MISIDTDKIDLNPNQPRRTFDKTALKELAGSIAQHGLINPVTVAKRDNGRYLLIAGERRYRAHKILKKEKIAALVTTGNPDEIALIENVQREDLHPLEEAAAYQRMIDEHGWTQEQLAKAVGKKRPTITNVIRLNNLDEIIKREAITNNKNISKSILMEISRQKDKKTQILTWKRIKRRNSTVKSIRNNKKIDDADKLISIGKRFVEHMEKTPTYEFKERDDLYHDIVEINKSISRLIESIDQELRLIKKT